MGVTVSSAATPAGTRSRILAAETCPLSTAIESVAEQLATLDTQLADERRAIRAAGERYNENLRRRDLLNRLAVELEARFAARPRRRKRAA